MKVSKRSIKRREMLKFNRVKKIAIRLRSIDNSIKLLCADGCYLSEKYNANNKFNSKKFSWILLACLCDAEHLSRTLKMPKEYRLKLITHLSEKLKEIISIYKK